MKRLNVTFDMGESHMRIAKRERDKIIVRTVQMPENLFNDGQMLAPHLVSDFIKELRTQYKLPKGECGLVVSDKLVVCRNLTLPAMTVEQLEVNLPFEFTDYISDEPEKYVYDYALKEMIYDEEGRPKEMNLTAAVMSKENVDLYANMLKSAGFQLRVVIPQEIAMTNVMRNALEEGRISKDREYCIINLGQKITQVFVFKGDELMVVRNIYIGSEIIDKAIAENENIDEFVARTYKNTNFVNILDRDYVQKEYSRIALEIRKVINFYRFNNRTSDLEDVYFIGGGSTLKGLDEMIAESNELNLGSAHEFFPPVVEEKADLSGFNAIGVMLQ